MLFSKTLFFSFLANYAKSGKRDDDIVGEITRPSSYSVVLNAVVSKDLNGVSEKVKICIFW